MTDHANAILDIYEKMAAKGDPKSIDFKDMYLDYAGFHRLVPKDLKAEIKKQVKERKIKVRLS